MRVLFGFPDSASGVFIRGFPPNKKTTRQRTKQGRRQETSFHYVKILAIVVWIAAAARYGSAASLIGLPTTI
jgi:hypothetical protein